MWFGTRQGLTRYDGYNFKVYVPDNNNSNSISSKDVESLLIDHKGILWVGTIDGLNIYHPDSDSFTFWHDPNGQKKLQYAYIDDIYEDNKKNIWLGTRSGLYVINQDRSAVTYHLHSKDNKYSISHNNIKSIFQDQTGNIWIGTDNGLNLYNKDTQQFIKLKAIGDKIIRAISQDTNGRLWIGTHSNGVYVYDITQQKIKHYKHDPNEYNSLSSNTVMDIFIDKEDRIWIGTTAGGLNLYNKQHDWFINYKKKPYDQHSLSDNTIQNLFVDNTGVFWIATYGNGISKFNPYGFSSSLVSGTPSSTDPNPQTNIRAFLIDQKGWTWVVSSNIGIRVTLPDGRKHSYTHTPDNPQSLQSDLTFSICEDKSGTIWVGGANGWLHRFDREKNSFKRIQLRHNSESSIHHGSIRSITEDKSGLLWIASDGGGLHSFNKKNHHITHYHHDPSDPDSLSTNRTIKTYEDQSGNLWILTLGGGLNRLDRNNGKFIVHHRNKNKTENIKFDLAIHEDVTKGDLWIGTNGSGLDRFNIKKNKFTNFNINHGLKSDSIYGILQDKAGHLWLSHNAGITRFNVNTMELKHYDKRDGLQSNEFNGGAYYQAPNGKFYFGGVNGYNAFYPEQIMENTHIPPVFITGFQLFNKPITINDKYNNRNLLSTSILQLEHLTLSHTDSVFSFEFAGLDYVSPSKNSYAFKMEGLENDWNYVDSRRRFATYTTLPPGDYTFRVKASNNNGIWNEQGVSLNITITPPFWQTWWFRILVILVIILLLLTMYTLRVKAIQARNIMLKKQVKERTQDLENTLLELSETKDALIESAHKAGMADSAIGVLHNVGNLLNSVVTSAGLIREIISMSVTKKFQKVNVMLSANKNHLGDYLQKDPKGQRLPEFIMVLIETLTKENHALKENSIRLTEKINSIKETITAQQRFAQGGNALVETLSLHDIIEDALLLQTGSIGRHEITIIKRFDESLPNIPIQKTKLVQILINLYKNAKESMDACKANQKILTIKTYQDQEHTYLSFQDTGLGIKKDQLNNIFSHGFTTKENGNGFGLHTCANYMSEMGGKIWAESDGLNNGATFIIQLPLPTDFGKTASNSDFDDNIQRNSA